MATKWQVIVKNFDGKPYTVDFNKPKEVSTILLFHRQPTDNEVHVSNNSNIGTPFDICFDNCFYFGRRYVLLS